MPGKGNLQQANHEVPSAPHTGTAECAGFKTAKSMSCNQAPKTERLQYPSGSSPELLG